MIKSWDRHCLAPTAETGKILGAVVTDVLLPLALEYHLGSRSGEIESTITVQLANINSNNITRKNSLYKVIVGGHEATQGIFKTFLPSSSDPLTADQVKDAVKALNLNRLSKINHLLDYINNQGFADRSGLGSLDHQMNQGDAGFSHSLLLFSDSLKTTGSYQDR